MTTEKEASKEACRKLRETEIGLNHPNISAYNDEYIIKNYTFEFRMFMDGWAFAKKSNNPDTTS